MVLALVPVVWWVISGPLKPTEMLWEILFCRVPFSVVIFPVRAFLQYSITIRQFQLHGVAIFFLIECFNRLFSTHAKDVGDL